MAVYAPGTDVAVSGSFFGTAIGRTLTFGSGATVHVAIPGS